MNASPSTRPLLLAAAAITLIAGAAYSQGGAAPSAAAQEITIPGAQVFPESVTSTHDGTVFIGSIGGHEIFRVKPGAHRAEPWIQPATDGLQSVLGVFADEASGTLYACSNTLAPGAASPPPHGTLYSFDLGSGAPRGHSPLPGGDTALCNDIAVGADGAVYATDTNNMQVVRMPKGGGALQVWAGDGAFGPKQAMVDGIALLGHRVLVSTLGSGKLYAVPIQSDGSAGTVTEVHLTRALERPDAIRSVSEDSVLVVERGLTGVMHTAIAWVRGGRGTLSQVTLSGDSGVVSTVKRGLSDDPVSVAVLGSTAYVLEGQVDRFVQASTPSPASSRPFRAMAVTLPAALISDKAMSDKAISDKPMPQKPAKLSTEKSEN